MVAGSNPAIPTIHSFRDWPRERAPGALRCEVMEEKPLILVTNDDGYDAPGIKALARAMENIGEVYTVAPDREKSASSHSGIDWQAHSLNIQERLVPEKKDERIFAVNGTPA